ncbi:5'/3'-nucleotidase SurE [Flavobacteriales bacterium]|jgi:5'-nucleotidase|nr:5'/3'-nucleotidase SurE [Flavobacteriales bacterium]
MSELLILITNDDGYSSKGIKALINAVKNLGKILIVAPDSPQSGMGHAISVNKPIRCYKTNFFDSVEAYCCTGTPVDCIKMGLYLLKNKKPDLILSGINHGSNVSTNILYSGTMSAAVEGALSGIPSVGYSLTDYSDDADFQYSEKIVQIISKKVIKEGLKKGTCLNVNIPNIKENQIKGIKVCRQGRAFWDDTFDHRKDPLGKDYYWLTGSFSSKEQAIDTDINYLENNYVTIVPTQFDMTCHDSVDELKKWKL